MRLRRAVWFVVPTVGALLVATVIMVGIVNTGSCGQLLDSPAAQTLFDTAGAERAAMEGVESGPPILVWLEADPPTRVWLGDSQRCDGKSQLRVLYRDPMKRALIQQHITESRLRGLGPAWLEQD